MSRSAYVTASSLTVKCPECFVAIGRRCETIDGVLLKRCHPARRKAADDKRTAEVNLGLLQGGRMYDPQAAYSMPFADLVDTFEIPPEVPLPPTHPGPRTVDLCPDDTCSGVDLAHRKDKLGFWCNGCKSATCEHCEAMAKTMKSLPITPMFEVEPLTDAERSELLADMAEWAKGKAHP